MSFPNLTLVEPLAVTLDLSVAELISCSKRSAAPMQTDATTQILLDVGKASNQRQKRKLRLFLAIVALIVIAAIGFGLDHFFVSTGEPVETQVFYKQEIGENNFLYVEDDSHLVRLRCDQDVYDSIRAHRDVIHYIRYRWNRFTYQGVLEAYLPEKEYEIAGRITDTVGNTISVESLLGIENVIIYNKNIYPNLDREKGFLYTLKLNHAGENTEYIGWGLLVENCRNYAFGDFDNDGIIELLVQTRYEEEPYMLYDIENGEIVYHFTDLPADIADTIFWFEPYYP